MRAVIIKELRENAVWALLLLVGLGGAFAFAMQGEEAKGLSLVGNFMAAATTVGFAAAGLVMGLLQILQDRRKGRWGFVVHRPISRTRIFFGKVIAGVALYLLAGGISLAAVVGWAATPGHVPGPFDWHMVMPRLADLFGGLMWYSVGLLIGSRKARWIGSRLMPIGAGVMISSIAYVFPMNLVEAIAILSGGIVLFLPAAWSAFVAEGVFENQPIAARVLQAVSVGTGIALSVAMIFGILVSIVEMVRPGGAEYWYDQYQVDTSGRVMRVTQGPAGGKVTDLNGVGLSNEQRDQFYKNQLGGAYLSLTGFPTGQSPWNARRDYFGLQGSSAYVHFIGRSGLTEWFYVVHRRTIEGFSQTRRRFAGSFGPSTCLPEWEAPKPFPEMLFPKVGYGPVENIAGRTAVYRLDFEKLGIRRIFHATVDDPVLDSSTDFKNGTESRLLNAIATHSAIHVFDEDREVCQIPIDPEGYHTVEVGQINNGRFVLRYTNAYGPYGEDAERRELLVEADGAGKILSRTELPPLPIGKHVEPGLNEGLQMVACPPFILGIALATRQSGARIDLVVVGLMGILSAIAAGIICRRYGMGPWASGLWILFSLVVGLSGPLVVVAMYQWQARVKCARCGKMRRVGRELCEHCGAPFPAPAMEGIEMLEVA